MARWGTPPSIRPAAVAAWRRALAHSPELVSFFAPLLEQALFAVGKRDKLEPMLADLLESNPGNVHLRLALARLDAKCDPQRASQSLAALVDDCQAQGIPLL